MNTYRRPLAPRPICMRSPESRRRQDLDGAQPSGAAVARGCMYRFGFSRGAGCKNVLDFILIG